MDDVTNATPRPPKSAIRMLVGLAGSVLLLAAGCDPCVNNPCNDGLGCNGLETCTADGDQAVCADGTLVECGAGSCCTEPDGACVDPCLDNTCDDGLFCNGAETCTADCDAAAGPTGLCVDGTRPCPPDESCREATDECESDLCLGNRCDDGDPCNGQETCEAATGDCIGGEALVCDDGDACNGVETCDPIDGCVDGEAVVCDPGEICDSESGDCVEDLCFENTCDDGDACNGLETCDADTGDCLDGTAVECADGEVCNPDTGACDPCTACTGDVDCPDDGLFCTGTEHCDAAVGCCVSSGDPCDTVAGETCSEDLNQCDEGGSCYDPGAAYTRSLSISPPNGTLVHGVEDTPPAAWTISSISDGGEWDAANVKVKWFFLDDQLRTLTYSATPPAGENGNKCFAGLVNFDGGSNQTAGADTCVPKCPTDGCYDPGVAVSRSFSITPPDGTLVYGVEDVPPAGWTISSISDGGAYDSANGKVKWFFLDDQPRTLSYNATPPGGASGTACFDGEVNFDGGSDESHGASMCWSRCP